MSAFTLEKTIPPTSSAESDVGIWEQPPCLQEETGLEELVLPGVAAGTGVRAQGHCLALLTRACGRVEVQSFHWKDLMAPCLAGFCRHPSSTHTLCVHTVNRKSHNSNTFLFGGVLTAGLSKQVRYLLSLLRFPVQDSVQNAACFTDRPPHRKVVSSPSESK